MTTKRKLTALVLCVAVSSCAREPVRGPDLTLPLSEYTASEDERVLVDRAYVVLLNRCLADHGQTRRVSGPAAPPKAAPLSWRYGLDDPAVAAEYGYHTPPEYGDRGNAERAAAERAHAGKRAGNDDPGVYAACVDDVQRTLGRPEGGGSYLDDVLAQSLGVTSFERSMADPGVRAALTRWSDCMRGEGHTATDPLRIMDEFDLTTDRPTAEEIAAATADVDCKEETGLVSVWHTAEVAHQRALIEDNRDALDAGRRSVDVAVRVAAETLGEPIPR